MQINGAARELLNEWCRSNHRMDLFLDAKSSAGPDPWFYTNSTTEKALTLNRHSYSTSARKSRARSLTSQSLILSSPDEEDCDDAKGRGRGGSLTPTTYQSFSSILATQQHTGSCKLLHSKAGMEMACHLLYNAVFHSATEELLMANSENFYTAVQKHGKN